MQGRCLFGIMGRCLCADVGFAWLCCGIISALSGETFQLLHLKIFWCCIPLLLISRCLLLPWIFALVDVMQSPCSGSARKQETGYFGSRPQRLIYRLGLQPVVNWVTHMRSSAHGRFSCKVLLFLEAVIRSRERLSPAGPNDAWWLVRPPSTAAKSWSLQDPLLPRRLSRASKNRAVTRRRKRRSPLAIVMTPVFSRGKWKK